MHHTYATDQEANGQANGTPGAAVLDADPPVDGGVATGHPHGHDEGGNHVPALVVCIDGQETDLDASALNDPSIAQDLRDAAANTAGTVDFHVADLPAWPAPDRWRLLSLVRSIGAKAHIGLGGHPPRADAFGALLDAMVGPENLERCQRGLEAAVDAAAVFHPEALPLACARIVEEGGRGAGGVRCRGRRPAGRSGARAGGGPGLDLRPRHAAGHARGRGPRTVTPEGPGDRALQIRCVSTRGGAGAQRVRTGPLLPEPPDRRRFPRTHTRRRWDREGDGNP